MLKIPHNGILLSIQSYDDNYKELTVIDDTMLEEHGNFENIITAHLASIMKLLL